MLSIHARIKSSFLTFWPNIERSIDARQSKKKKKKKKRRGKKFIRTHDNYEDRKCEGTIKEMANPFLPWDSHNAVTNVGAEEKAQGPPMLQQSSQSRHFYERCL